MAREELIIRPSPLAVHPGAYRGLDVAALRADAGNEQRHLTGQRVRTRAISAGKGGADHQRALPVHIPFAC
jgi:hypothetical protein